METLRVALAVFALAVVSLLIFLASHYIRYGTGPRMTPRSAAVNELKSTYTMLKGDVDAAVVFGKANGTQFARRTLVRTLFAFIEGLTNQLSSVAAASAPTETGIFSAGELAALREESYDVNEQGLVETRAARISLKRRIRLAFRCYPRIHGASFNADLGGQGWSALQDAIRIRDRLTHPKGDADLSVSDSDLTLVGTASGWYQDSIVALLKACQDADAAFSPPPAA